MKVGSRRLRFNPHPATRPGATACTDGTTAPIPEFQSSPGHATGRDLTALAPETPDFKFQSSPGHATGRDTSRPRWWCTPPRGFNPHPATRPGATRLGCLGFDRLELFQSSPGHATGRDGRWPAPRYPRAPRFNPHPATRPGATSEVRPCVVLSLLVSILTRPRDRARRYNVLTETEDLTFQSSPGHATGRDCHCCQLIVSDLGRFNPHPATRPGATSPPPAT